MTTSATVYMDAGCFNPHTHAGCDEHTDEQLRAYNVSIHTPTQGVTDSTGVYSKVDGFNPHTHAGCDSISNNIL